MKIALFSDIHANLPALNAVLKDIDARDVDQVYCLGDLVGYNVWPNEVVRIIQQRRIPCITGNYDFGIGQNINECGCAYKTEEDKANGALSISYTNAQMGEDERKYLKGLPFQLALQFRLAEEPFELLLVHASPRRINEYLFEDRSDESLSRIMTQARTNAMCFGHTHKPFFKRIEQKVKGKSQFQFAVNIGSVGKPKDGDPRACYAILNINENASPCDPNAILVEFIRVQYPVQEAANAIENSPLPNAYAKALHLAK